MANRSNSRFFRQRLAEEKQLEREMRDRAGSNRRGRIRDSSQKLRRNGVNNRLSDNGATVMVPVSGGVITRPLVPRFLMKGDTTVVHNTEILNNQTLAALGAFATNNTPLIAGQPSWLAQVADLYSKYRWLKATIIYIPKCPTTTSGSIVMALNYDRNDAAPTTRGQLSQTYKAINFPPYAGYDGAVFLNSTNGQGAQTALYIDLDVDKLDKPWYPTISSGTFAGLGVLDQNQFCPASLIVGSDGGPTAATPAGDIFIKYSIQFIEPINPTMNV